MRGTQNSDYALRSLSGLIASDGQSPVSIHELAVRYYLARQRLKQIMLEPKSSSPNWSRRQSRFRRQQVRLSSRVI